MRWNRFGELRADRVAVKIPHLISPKGRGTGGVAPLGGDRFRGFTSAASPPEWHLGLGRVLGGAAKILGLPANYSQQSAQPLATDGVASVEQLRHNEASSRPN
jgi:hypothetical protein